MFDTMTLTKVVGGFCGALLIFLLGQWAAEVLYSTAGGHGEHHEQAYVIDTGDDEGEAEAEEEQGPTFAELFVQADAGKGERVFNKCKACHNVEDGANATGPHLYGVVGREVASVDGFGYSGSLKPVADAWTPRELSAFLADPSGYAPGTTMGFAGLGDIEDRANVIAYLDQTDGDTYEIEMPEEEAAAEEAATEEAATEEAAAEEAATDEAATEEAAAEEGSAEGAAAEEAATEQAAAEEGTTEEQAVAEDTAAAEGTSEIAQMVAAADPGEGEQVYRRCSACHRLEEGANAVGPHLYDTVGREIAGVEGFRYSKALEELEGTWTVEELDAWLENPREYAPDNRMSFAGLRKAEDRAAVIAYLKTIGD